MGKVRISHGIKQLLADDPCGPLVYAVEQVQAQAHYRRLPRVLKYMRRRKYELGWVHASEATNPCERVLAAQLLGYKLPREKIEPRLSRIFENGTYMHLRFSNYFLSLPAPFEVQVAVILRRWPLIGEADAIISHPKMGNIIIELKSINDRNFKLLRKPQDGHAAQVNTYMGLFMAGNVGCSGQVWYENKNDQTIKAYHHQFIPNQFHEMHGRLEDIANSVILGTLPNACEECEYDDFVADLKGVEERMAQLAKTKENHNG